MNHKKLAVAVAGACALLSSAGANAFSFTQGDWTLDISGSVNGFYTQQNCDPISGGTGTISGTLLTCANDTASVQNGLLPGYLNFVASGKQNGIDIKGQIGIWPGTSNSNAAQALGDVRTVYLQFGTPTAGTLKLGRDIGLFQQQAILNDMTLIGVGTGANFQGAINTTLGMIGTGYVYTEFQPQVTYTTPNMGGLSASLGVFQPRNTLGVGTATVTDKPGVQGLASFDFKSGKVWASFVNQEAKTAAGVERKGNGAELGGKIGFGGLEAMLVGFTGKGLGKELQFLNSHDAAGNKRDSDGFLAQLTYKVGNTKFGASYGESKLEFASAADAAAAPDLIAKSKGYVLGVYHSLTPNLTLVGEFISQKQEAHNGASQDADTVAAGAILFF